MLYRPTGLSVAVARAPMKNLTHRVSSESIDKNALSKTAIKHLVFLRKFVFW